MSSILSLACLCISYIEASKGNYAGFGISIVFTSLWINYKKIPAFSVSLLTTALLIGVTLTTVGQRFQIIPVRDLGLTCLFLSGSLLILSRLPIHLIRKDFIIVVFALYFVWNLANGQIIPFTYRTLFSGNGGVAYIQSGVWANGSKCVSSLDIESEYASTEFVKKIGATVVDIEMLSGQNIDNYKAIFLFTPTRPLSVNSIELIRKWVLAGGTLYAIADHTNLLGHADVVNDVIRPFGVRLGFDAVINTGRREGNYYGLHSGRLIGLTPCSVYGRGDPLFWTIGYSEEADYSNTSFFGDLTPSDGDKYGLFFVGLRTTYGLGQIISFTDSTFFSNFAISRYSSSAALSNLISSSACVPVYDIMIVILALNLAKKRRRLVAGIVLTAATTSIFVIKVEPDQIQLDNSKPTRRICGDPLLTDTENGPLASLLAAHFSYDDRALTWADVEYGCGFIEIDGVKVTTSLQPDISNLDVTAIIAGQLPSELNLFSRQDTAHYGPIWFDDGPGYVRERILASFWSRSEPNLKIFSHEFILCSGINTGKFNEPINVNVYWLTSTKDWALLGEGLVARWLKSEGVFLVRKSWQQLKAPPQTFVLKAITN